MVDGLIKLMDSEKYIGPINIGNPHELTIKNLATIIKDKVRESSSQIKYYNLPQDDPVKRKPNIEKAINNLNWRPTVELNDGLDKTINYFKFLT